MKWQTIISFSEKQSFDHITMLIIKLTLLSICLFISIGSMAQTSLDELIPNLKPNRIIKLAENASKAGDYYSAIKLHEAYIKEKPQDEKGLFLLAQNYRLARDYKNAAENYKKVKDIDDTKYPTAYYYYADMLMQMEKYEEALEAFEQARRVKLDRVHAYAIRRKMDGCENAINKEPMKQRVKLFHLDTSINKANTEQSPYFINSNTMIYSAVKKDSFTYYPNVAEQIKLPVSKFYLAKKQNDTSWTDQGEWKFNNENTNTGNGVYSLNKKRFYFTKCRRDYNNKPVCGIYYSDRNGNQWTEAKRISTLSDPNYTYTQITLGKESRYDKEVIYFVSDMPGGRGGLDIWYVTYNPRSNEFSAPDNAGARINSRGNDITPHFNLKSGTLYFSSDYHPGYGGYDVFMSKGEQRRWTEPENIGYLVNSGADELYYTVNPLKTNEGFFTSNREGSISAMHPTCCDDIYYYQKEIVDKIYIKGTVAKDDLEIDSNLIQSDLLSKILEKTHKSNIIIDESLENMIDKSRKKGNAPKEVLKEAIVSSYLIDKDTKEEVHIFSDTTEQGGSYIQELEPYKDYKIVIKKDGYFNQNFYVSTRDFGWSDTIKLQSVDLKPIPSKPIQFSVHYELNSNVLNEESKRNLDSALIKILTDSPDLIVEISSHTDSTGSDEYNQDLSQQRAENIVNYLIEKGIDKSRLIATGYGSTKPIADNATEEGRAINRRTEFKVIGSIDQFSKINTTDIEKTKINPNAPPQTETQEE